ncbi:MAG: hypothetical protein H0T79_24045 [Deltaproteobacteria bacterium]|nr:hypothetical protein [Deltaproteobacteria bacterium]
MRSSLCAALAAIGIGVPAIAVAELPMMDREKPVVCARDTRGHAWRLQCDPVAKVCLYAANDELDSTGEPVKPLERATSCTFDEPFDRKQLESAGYTMRPARADAPWGWTRDDRGRVFQVNFDLRRRVYFGAAYTPQKVLELPFQSTRTSIDFGFLVLDIPHGRTRHRIRLVEGEVHLEPFSAELTLAHWDFSHRFLDPLLRITTFVGEPSRHDVTLNLGMWTEAGGLELHRTAAGNAQLWKHATANVTIDLWQSDSLDSYARLRTGLGLEGQHDDVNGYRSALTAGSAFELDVVVDDAGFHNVRFELGHELPRYFVAPPNRDKLAQRLRAKLQYEAIVLAINDQPLTLKVAAGGEKRDDIPGVPDQWAFVMDAGLRFSLWAPPRPR